MGQKPTGSGIGRARGDDQVAREFQACTEVEDQSRRRRRRNGRAEWKEEGEEADKRARRVRDRRGAARGEGRRADKAAPQGSDTAKEKGRAGLGEGLLGRKGERRPEKK